MNTDSSPVNEAGTMWNNNTGRRLFLRRLGTTGVFGAALTGGALDVLAAGNDGLHRDIASGKSGYGTTWIEAFLALWSQGTNQTAITMGSGGEYQIHASTTTIIHRDSANNITGYTITTTSAGTMDKANQS